MINFLCKETDLILYKIVNTAYKSETKDIKHSKCIAILFIPSVGET